VNLGLLIRVVEAIEWACAMAFPSAWNGANARLAGNGI